MLRLFGSFDLLGKTTKMNGDGKPKYKLWKRMVCARKERERKREQLGFPIPSPLPPSGKAPACSKMLSLSHRYGSRMMAAWKGRCLASHACFKRPLSTRSAGELKRIETPIRSCSSLLPDEQKAPNHLLLEQDT